LLVLKQNKKKDINFIRGGSPPDFALEINIIQPIATLGGG
jgi:hypothetical protein